MDVLQVNKKLLGELEEMGFPLARAMTALCHSGNSSLEDAISWIVEHENDPEIDEMPPVRIEIEGSESYSVSEELKLKAQKLRDKALKRKNEEDNRAQERIRLKLHQDKDKVDRRGGLGFPQQRHLSFKSITPIVQENKNQMLPVTSNGMGINLTTKVDLMRDCLRSLRRNNKDHDFKVKRAFETLLIYVRNVARYPNEDKFRKIRLNNPAFKERVGGFEEGVKFLELCGFERVEGGKYLVLARGGVDMAVLKSAGNELQSAITNPYFGLLSTGK